MIINFGVGFYGYTEVLGLALMVSGLSECSSDGFSSVCIAMHVQLLSLSGCGMLLAERALAAH